MELNRVVGQPRPRDPWVVVAGYTLCKFFSIHCVTMAFWYAATTSILC